MNVYGVMIIMSLALFPYVYVIARAAFLTKFRSLIEASQTLGAFSTRTFFQVVLPVSRPALVAGVTLVSMEVLNDYGAVKYFGIPTFTTGIFRSWFSYEDVQAAVYLSSLLLLFVFMILLIEKKQRGEERFYSAATAERPLQMEKPNKVRQLMVLTCCTLPVIFGFAIPVIQLAWWSISSYKSVAHIDLFAAVGNSFMLALGTAISCVLVAVLLLFVCRMQNSRIYNWFMKLSTMGYAIPGAVVAIGVLMPLLLIDKQLISIFQYFGEIDPGLILTGTTVGLLFALTVRFLSVAFNPIESGFEKIGYSLDEVASTLRANPLSRLTRINLPLLKGALGTAALLVFVDILKELPLTLILRPFNFNTLATRSFELASDEQIAAAAVPSIIIIITGLIPVYLLNALITKRSKA
jgi:iron(III) transport system permease protein